ncbi:bola protein [Thelonectria olida]|uniref:Bola protein n=1 Tax=Thelonectria olida TaxID=1576542 RepID=A0A9P9ASE7_9HYPO|nr:bola protein [Thelonectria olida]
MICTACRLAARRALRTAAASPSAMASSSPSSSSRVLALAAPTLLHRSTPAPSSYHCRSFSASRTLLSADAAAAELPSMTPAESAIAAILSEKLSPTQLLVQDVSGGCGSMYAIDITSAAFQGQTILKQQRMVNAALGDLVKSWHGVQIRTKVPPQDA